MLLYFMNGDEGSFIEGFEELSQHIYDLQAHHHGKCYDVNNNCEATQRLIRAGFLETTLENNIVETEAGMDLTILAEVFFGTEYWHLEDPSSANKSTGYCHLLN